MTISRRVQWYFLSSIGAPLLGFISLPLFTTRLGPEQYGAFALGSALAGIVSATAGSVSVLNLPAHLGRISEVDRRHYLTAVFLLALVAALVSCSVVFGLYSICALYFNIELLTREATVLAIAGAFLNSVWAPCVEILTIEGRARSYAVTTFLQASVNVVAVSLALFLFNDLEHALFWGFVASALVGMIGAMTILARSLVLGNLRIWFSVAGRGSVAAITSSLSENGKSAVERFYLAAMIGIVPLGLLAHAYYYKNASMAVLNALSRAVLPTSLVEASKEKPCFSETLRVWKLVQAFVFSLALGFALLGNEMIGLLTNDKFIDASEYTVALILILLLQTSVKPHSTLLLSRGQGHIQAHLNTFAIALALLWLFVSVPYVGVWGAISAFFLQILIHRVGVFMAANRLSRIPFPDLWVVIGIIVVCACMLLVECLKLDFAQRFVLLLMLYALIALKLKSDIELMWTSLLNR